MNYNWKIMNKSIAQLARMNAESIRQEQIEIQKLDSKVFNEQTFTMALDNLLAVAERNRKKKISLS